MLQRTQPDSVTNPSLPAARNAWTAHAVTATSVTNPSLPAARHEGDMLEKMLGV